MGTSTGAGQPRGPGGWGPPHRRRAATRAQQAVRLAALALAVGGCSLDGLLKSQEIPSNVTDPAITQTPAGAHAAYAGVLARFETVFGNAALLAGALLGDELQSARGFAIPEDQRLLPVTGDYSAANYAQLHAVRGQAGQAIGLLTRYAPAERALVGQAYNMQAYAEIFLAELFCSGIPLSTLDFDGDYTYRPGSSTAEVFRHAVALFDTALTLVGDNSAWVALAQVGQGRAWLALGDYARAAAVVAAVPDGYRYEVRFAAADPVNGGNFAWTGGGLWGFTVGDREGFNGLDYRSSGDPRTTVTVQGTNTAGQTVYYPDKYATDGSSPIVLASGVEARLIQAEAALQAGEGSWLTILNTLRTDGTQDGGGVYQPGTGGVAGLAPLADPGTPPGRVDLMFRERAFWLFLAGHRQGDLRRLIRQYGRTQATVYPVGPYLSGVVVPPTTYGTDVTEPVPGQEQVLNPSYTGCISRDA